MKYHITPKQAKEISEEQFYSMFNEIVPREDWANYHHKKMNIGKMIELLDEVTIKKSQIYELWYVNDTYSEKELVDALWEAFKDKI